MKNTSILLFICCIICTAFINHRLKPVDYRDAYTGSYFCTRNCRVLNTMHNTLIDAVDTITINVSKDLADSVLDIFVQHNTYKVKLANNILYSYPAGSHWGGKLFSSDSISFIATPALGPSSFSLTGKKN